MTSASESLARIVGFATAIRTRTIVNVWGHGPGNNVQKVIRDGLSQYRSDVCPQRSASDLFRHRIPFFDCVILMTSKLVSVARWRNSLCEPVTQHEGIEICIALDKPIAIGVRHAWKLFCWIQHAVQLQTIPLPLHNSGQSLFPKRHSLCLVQYLTGFFRQKRMH